jgi:Ca-activated chloride channel family protein
MPQPPSYRGVTCFLAVVLAGLACPGLIQSQQDDVVRVNTDLVVLNITVTDKAGQYVPGLRLSDFTIFEDGKEVSPELVSSFSVHESPFASVVLLDTSGSMESRLSLARSAAIRFLDRLREEDVAAVYKFDSKVEQVQEFSSSRDLAPIAYGVRAEGMTTLNDAIVDAAKALSQRQEKRKAIIVLSDGLDTYSKATSENAVESALAVGATIYAVDMSAAEGGSFRNLQSAGILKSFAA